MNFARQPEYNPLSFTCRKTGYSKKEIQYFYTVIGEMGEPKHISGVERNYKYNDNLTVALNLVGGVYGLVSTHVESMSTKEYLTNMFTPSNE